MRRDFTRILPENQIPKNTDACKPRNKEEVLHQEHEVHSRMLRTETGVSTLLIGHEPTVNWRMTKESGAIAPVNR